MVITAAAAALGSVKAAYDLGKAAYGFNVSTEVKLAISDMLDKLISAKQQAMDAVDSEQALHARIRELEEEIGRIKATAAELENYEPKSFYPGVTVYVLKHALAADKHPHKLCEHCYRQGQKSELHATGERRRNHRQHLCPSCKTEYWMGSEIPPEGPTEEPRPEPKIERGESSWLSARRGGGPNDWMKG